MSQEPLPTPALGDITHTSRGFPIIKFKDKYGVECSLQVSSLAEFEKPGTSAVWLGPVKPNPQVMWKDAEALGIPTNQKCGWVPFPMPDGVQCDTRAHLDRVQVAALIRHLQSWLDTDEF